MWMIAAGRVSGRAFQIMAAVVVLSATVTLSLYLWARPRPFISAAIQCEYQWIDIDRAQFEPLEMKARRRIRILGDLSTAQWAEWNAARDIIGIRNDRSFSKSKPEDMVSIQALGRRSAFARDVISRAMIKFAESDNERQALDSELNETEPTRPMGSSETNYNDMAFYFMVGEARTFLSHFEKAQSKLKAQWSPAIEDHLAQLYRLRSVAVHKLDLDLLALDAAEDAPMSQSHYKKAFKLITSRCGEGTLRFRLAKYLGEW
jgi:hypothetical protein